MIKAIIMDDEYLVVEAMKTLIDWKKYNMEIVGTSMDGQGGFDLIVEKEPHIVLTDIRMPGMDGLSIIEKAKYIFPAMQFIIFSGYTDFAYAKKAIALGVLEYIVKPITVEKVENALQKALAHISDRDNLLLEKKIEEMLMLGEDIAEEEWEAAKLPVPITSIRECLILSCSIPGENIAIREYINRRKELRKYNIFYCVYPAISVVMCLSGGIHGKEKMLSGLSGVMQMWRESREDCYIGVSYRQTGQTGIREVFNQAREAMSYAVFVKENCLVDFQELQMSRRLPSNIQKYERIFLESIEHGQVKNIENTVHIFMEECRELHTEPKLVKHFVLEFFYNALSLEQKLISDGVEHKLHMWIDDEYECPPHEYVEHCHSYQVLTEWFSEEMKKIAERVSEKKGGKSRIQIQVVKDYIHTYYQKDLTLFELAEVAKMAPTYFSDVFKQEVGTTYIKYLTKVRMERAKELLHAGYKVADVSEQIGYRNYRYFCEIFKKYTGMTAQQFKGINSVK